MSDLKDFYAFKSTSANGGNGGCSLGCLPWIIGIVVILWIISKLF